jgi:Ca-activated chloride channel family protein
VGEYSRVEEAGELLDTVGHTRRRPREVRVRVDGDDGTAQRAGRLVTVCCKLPLERRALVVEPTRRGDDELGLGSGHRLPRRLLSRLPGSAEKLDPACRLNHLGQPVPARKRRVEPLGEHDTPGRESGDPLADRVDAGLHPRGDRRAALRHVEPARECPHAVRDLGERARVERDDLRADLAHLAARDRAHAAQVLGDDQVGPQSREQVGVERIQGLARRERLAHRPVDRRSADRGGVDATRGHHRQLTDRIRIVAFLRASNELLEQPQLGDDLGCAREEGDDSHNLTVTARVAGEECRGVTMTRLSPHAWTMSFERPLLLLTLFLVPVAVALYVLAQRRGSRYAITFPNLDVLAAVASDRRAWWTHVPPLLVLLALGSLSVALARPHVNRLVPIERATTVLVIDTSRSMQSQDVRPTRLGAAKAAAQTFLDRAPARLRVGLVVFAGDVQVAAAPTVDRELLHTSVDAIGWPTGFGGTAIGDALARAVEVGQRAISDDEEVVSAGSRPVTPVGPRGIVSILFLSDGRQNRGLLQPAEGAARAKAAGIPVFTVSLGTRQGGAQGGSGVGFGFGGRNRQPDPETLRAIARTTGGEFFEATTARSLGAAYANLGSRLGRAPRRTEVTFAFAAAAAGILVAAGLLSPRWWPRLP